MNKIFEKRKNYKNYFIIFLIIFIIYIYIYYKNIINIIKHKIKSKLINLYFSFYKI